MSAKEPPSRDHARVVDEASGREPSIYGHRFSADELRRRQEIWKTLCSQFFQRYVPQSATVVDVGAGDGFFIRNITARQRIAVDVSPHVLPLQKEGIEVIQRSATSFAAHLSAPADVVFMSNFLEHLPHKNLVLEVFEECSRALRQGGRLIILQPNIRHLGAAYWDFIDHHIALTDTACVEGLEISGFRIERVVSQFLPYTVKSTLGGMSGLLPLYLKLPIIWPLFGKQSLIIAQKI